MSTFNIAVLVSGNGSNLQSLINLSLASNSNFKICCVGTNNPEANALKRIEDEHISSISLDHSKFDSREEFDMKMAMELQKFNIDLLVLAGYMRILSKDFINLFKNKIINLHPSLLPKYPGLNTHEKVLENNDIHHGVTVHYVDEGLDTGPIIGFTKVETTNHDIKSLEKKIHEIEHKLLPTIVSLMSDGRVELQNRKVLIDMEVYKNGKEFIF
jgi:phosphoribosylglycinamide formyltransferase-1